MNSINILIATRNRAASLKACLLALGNQTIKPFEVIIVDNDSQDNTRHICYSFKKNLPIRYKKERQVGLPFARNVSLQLTRRELCAFIDDDCIASPDWLKQILTHFQRYPQAVGVIGKTENANPKNMGSSVEYAYYLQWLGYHITNVRDTEKLSSGLCIDFKNAAFRSSFIKQFKFSTTAPYGDVGDEDVEMGYHLFKANQNIYYNPSIQVTHQYSTTMQRLFIRNFWNGYANQKLYQTHGVDVSKGNNAYIKKTVLQDTTQIQGLFRQWTYKGVKAIFPVFSGLGRLYAIATKPKVQIIPPRS